MYALADEAREDVGDGFEAGLGQLAPEYHPQTHPVAWVNERDGLVLIWPSSGPRLPPYHLSSVNYEADHGSNWPFFMLDELAE